jgi:hypothetical protein
VLHLLLRPLLVQFLHSRTKDEHKEISGGELEGTCSLVGDGKEWTANRLLKPFVFAA